MKLLTFYKLNVKNTFGDELIRHLFTVSEKDQYTVLCLSLVDGAVMRHQFDYIEFSEEKCIEKDLNLISEDYKKELIYGMFRCIQKGLK